MERADAEVWAALTTGIYILTTRSGSSGHGMSASWVVQVSGTPPLLAAAVGRQTFSHERITADKVFGLNVVGKRSRFLQDYFHSASARRPENLDAVHWFWSPGKVPWLTAALLRLECHVIEEVAVGDRTLFVSRIGTFRWGEADRPLSSHDLPYVYVGEIHPTPRWQDSRKGGPT